MLSKYWIEIRNCSRFSDKKKEYQDQIVYLPFPNEYARIVTELFRASFLALITSKGSPPEFSPAAKNNMTDSINNNVVFFKC